MFTLALVKTPFVRHICHTAIAATILLLPLAAHASDGLYVGALSCGPSGTSAAFTQAVSLALRGGTGEWSGGKPGQNGYHTSTLSAAADGTVRVDGYYLVGEDRRQTSLTGRAKTRSITASGRRGPRDCRLVIDRPPPTGAQVPYRLPYDVAAIRAQSAVSPPASICAEPETVPRDLLIEGFYRLGDPTYSQIDHDRLAIYNAALKPIRSFESAVSRTADRALRAPGTVTAPSACVLSLLDRWASAGALLRSVSSQGAYERKWSAITYAFAFMESRSVAHPDQADRIANWLSLIGDRVAVHYMQPASGTISDRANNHAYWAALSAVSTGLAAQDADLFDWGMTRFLAALNDIDADGYLALELARGSKALHYHRFSLEPLLLLALIARANEIAIPRDGHVALQRLVERVRRGLDDPGPFAERSGRPQDDAGRSRADWAWAELALALYDDSGLDARIAPLRPLSARWLGGNLTLRYTRQ